MTYDRKADRIREFLNDRDLINKRQLALQVNVDPANFHRWLKEQTPWRIAPEAIDQISDIIKKYGYR